MLKFAEGLDPSRYRNSSSAESEERYFSTLDSRMSDSQRYRDAKPFIVHCRRCEAQFPFTPIHEQDVSNCYHFRFTFSDFEVDFL
jgi:DNA polymerase alpha subunit A